jgi:shikimate kinase
MIVFLLGFMGSGKSTIGKKLSNRIKLNFVDLDSAIESKEGRSVGEIFAKEGEDYFRNVEAEVLRSLLTEAGSIIACGGGTPCFKGNLDFMNKTGTTVYLEMSPAALKSRLFDSRQTRPLISHLNDNELIDYISETLKEREKWYRKARLHVDGISTDITQLCDLLQAQGS